MTNKEQMKALLKEIKNLQDAVKDLENIKDDRVASINEAEKKVSLLTELLSSNAKRRI